MIAVTFDRIGRTYDPPPIHIADDDMTADGIADAVYHHARKYLASSWFSVTAHWDPDDGTGTVTIEGGRFGDGTIKRVATT